MINIAEKMKMKDTLRTRIAERMIERGEVLKHDSRSNYYACMDSIKVKFYGHYWHILYVDGLACRIEKLP